MKKRILLHIGFPKTGTTTIQNFLYEHREILLKETGVLYPSLAANLTDALCTMFLNDPSKHITNKMRGITEKGELTDLARAYQHSLEKEFSSVQYDTILLSAEGVANLQAEEIHNLKNWGDQYTDSWTVIAYVRHPVNYTRSVIQQLMKSGQTLEQLYENAPLPNYKGRLRGFIEIFGKENINVFDFESAAGANLLHSFCENIDLNTVLIQNHPDFLINKRANTSMSMEAVLVLNRINHLRPVFIKGERNKLRSNQEVPQVQRLAGHTFVLPHPVETKIKEKTREDISWLNEEFELNLYHDIFSSPEANAPSSAMEVQNISEKTINSIANIILDLVDAKREMAELKSFSRIKRFHIAFKELLRKI
jgi:hypothetical protein